MKRSGTNARDAGASQVIGFILIAGIALVAATVVLLGGGPALRQVQDNQESEAFVGHMGDLHSEISGLLTGSPASTTPTWRFSMAQGSVALQDSGHLWGYAVDLSLDSGDWRFEYGDLYDDDNVIQVEDVNGLLATLTVTANQLTGSTTSPVTVSVSGGPTYDLTLTQGGAAYSPNGKVTEFLLINDDGVTKETVARFYLLDSGAMVWSGSGQQLQTVAYQNTGLVAKRDGGELLLNQPNLRPPQVTDDDGDKESVYLRVVKLSGDVSVGGRSSTTVLLTSDGNHQRYATSNAERVAVYPPDTWGQAWQRTLTDSNLGYDWSGSGTNSLGAWRVFHDKSDEGLEELAGTLVETNIRAGVD